MQISSKQSIGIGLGVGVLGVLFFAATNKSKASTFVDRNINTSAFTNVYGGSNFLLNEVRGLRNNNPANIRISNVAWKGKIPKAQNTDGHFEQFISYPYGIRALIKLINTYYYKRGLQTVRAIISRFAPNNENNTQGYIAAVSKSLGVQPNTSIFLTDKTVKVLVLAIDKIENGKRTISEQHYQQALQLL